MSELVAIADRAVRDMGRFGGTVLRAALGPGAGARAARPGGPTGRAGE